MLFSGPEELEHVDLNGNPEEGNARFHQDVGTCVSDSTASHTMNP